MKTLKIIIFVWIIFFILFYIGGSFSQASFNLSEWNNDVRFGIGITYLGVAVVAALGISMEMLDPKYKK